MTDTLIHHLIAIESEVHYNQPPPVGDLPFVVINRNSPVLLSAPHGCRTYRHRNGETWHEEDEYTAGMALLLGELCEVSVIATIWRTDDSDPNDTREHDEIEKRISPYKKAVRTLCEQDVFWVIDLHGAGQDTPNMAAGQWIDLGLGRDNTALPEDVKHFLLHTIESEFGVGSANRNGRLGFPASVEGRSITAFVNQNLHKHAIQIEMKPSVRIVQRRPDASMFTKPGEYGGAFSAPPENVLKMIKILRTQIEYIKEK